jgi:HEAT repeat protein
MSRALVLLFLVGCAMPERVEQIHQEVSSLMASSQVQNFARRKVQWKKLGSIVWSDAPEPPEFQRVVRKGKEAVPTLIALLELNDDQRDIRVASWLALSEISHRDFGSLYPFWARGERSREARREAIAQWKKWWTENADRSRAEWFRRDLESDDRWLQIRAAESLAEAGERSAIPTLRKALSSRAEGVAVAAVAALATLRDPCSTRPIIQLLLESPEVSLRQTGIEALKSMTGRTLGYEPTADEELRREAVARWIAWCAAHCRPSADSDGSCLK